MPRWETCVLSGSRVGYDRDFIVTIDREGLPFTIVVWPWKGVQVAFNYYRGETVSLRVETKLGAVSFHRQMPILKLPPPVVETRSSSSASQLGSSAIPGPHQTAPKSTGGGEEIRA